MQEAARVAYSPRETAARMGWGLTFTYDCIRKGRIRAVKVGRKVVIPAAELDRLLGTD